ncbi:hypothetical protein CEXT_221 [Caerostris extrusa]|uniref:Uncharacterized protein n=1 Tax=Caerostris extrusa TaxID=172846 RepID=A0AAV4T9Z2_CAEEX|nr:hypothetical protein CEXT_221 [Caerostris extrusa]
MSRKPTRNSILIKISFSACPFKSDCAELLTPIPNAICRTHEIMFKKHNIVTWTIAPQDVIELKKKQVPNVTTTLRKKARDRSSFSSTYYHSILLFSFSRMKIV